MNHPSVSLEIEKR